MLVFYMPINSHLIKFKNFIISRWPIIVFLLCFIMGAFMTYQDYGITWDERDVYVYGEQYYLYTTGKPASFFNRDLGSAQKENLLVLYNHFYPGILYGLSYHINGSREIDYTFFHLLNLIVSSTIFIFIFEVLLRKYKKSYYAILGPILLLFVPRFIGELPTNVRDVSFALAFTISISLIYLLRGNNSIARLIVLGLSFGFSQTLRVVGFTLYFIYLAFSLIQELRINRGISLKYIKLEAQNLIVISFISFFVNIITSPYLGSNFVVNFINSLKYSRAIVSKGTMLFNGEEILYANAGIDYLPTILLVTTPIFILIFAGFSLFKLIKNRFKNDLLLIFWISITLSIALYFVTKPIIFDGIRHFLFLLPLLSVVSTIGFIEFVKIKNLKIRAIGILLMGINLILVLIQYASLYPYQYIYYNELIGYVSGANSKYEKDYWGASYKEAIEWLKENEIDSTKEYNIKTCAHPMQSVFYFEDNMNWVNDMTDANYYVCYDRSDENLLVDQSKLIHTVNRQGIAINYIYKLK